MNSELYKAWQSELYKAWQSPLSKIEILISQYLDYNQSLKFKKIKTINQMPLFLPYTDKQ